MGTPHLLVLWRILLPGSLLPILTGVRIALGFCFVLTISAEMIGHHSGPHQRVTCSGRVIASHTRAAGASNRRVIRISVSDGSVTTADP